jgi:hypothetical protein
VADGRNKQEAADVASSAATHQARHFFPAKSYLKYNSHAQVGLKTAMLAGLKQGITPEERNKILRL